MTVRIRHGAFAGLIGEVTRGPEGTSRLELINVALQREQCDVRCTPLPWVLDEQGRVEVTFPVCNTEAVS